MNLQPILERAGRLVVDDAWRKGLALALAIGIWFLAFQKTTATDEKDLFVRPLPTSDRVPPTPGILGIRVGTGMRVVSAPVVRVTVRGPRRELERLDGLAGEYDPGPGFEGGQVVFAVESILWHPPRVRDVSFRIEPSPVTVEFGRIERREVQLDARVLSIEGAPAEGYQVHKERARFYPSRAFVRGLRRDFAALDGPEGFRLAPLELEGNTSSAVLRLGLHPELEKVGLELDPPAVEVEIPIEPAPNEVRFRADVAAVFTDTHRATSRPPFVLADDDREREFVLAFRGPPPFQPPGPEGAALFVEVFVDLAEITPRELASETVEEVELPLRWYLKMPPGERSAAPLTLRPADGRRMTARVIRKIPE